MVPLTGAPTARPQRLPSQYNPRMKLAFSTLGCPAWSLDQVTAAARDLGYEGVELRLLDGEVIPPDLAPAERQRVKRHFAGAGVAIACLDTSARFTAPDPAQRRAQEEDVRRYLELANEWETALIRVFGGNLAPGQSEEEGVSLLAESSGAPGPRRRTGRGDHLPGDARRLLRRAPGG